MVTEKITPLAFGHSVVVPVMEEVTGVALVFTVMLTGEPVPQEEVSVQVIVPPLAPKLTVMEFVPAPAVMVAPAGTVQL